MNEWQLQKSLTATWGESGLSLGGERHMLIAWEAMVPSWRINDAHGFWAEPSIDFLFMASDGSLLAVELKTSIPGVRPAWRALCQVTHRAVELESSWLFKRMAAAFSAAWSGGHGRVGRAATESLDEAHRHFFGSSASLRRSKPVFRRAVAATTFGRRFDSVLSEFNSLGRDQLRSELDRLELADDRRVNKEPRRLLDSLNSLALPPGDVIRIDLDPEPAMRATKNG